MTEKKIENGKGIVYDEREEQVSAGVEAEKDRDAVIFQLADIISCLNFCGHEIDKLRKTISEKIQNLSNLKK